MCINASFLVYINLTNGSSESSSDSDSESASTSSSDVEKVANKGKHAADTANQSQRDLGTYSAI